VHSWPISTSTALQEPVHPSQVDYHNLMFLVAVHTHKGDKCQAARTMAQLEAFLDWLQAGVATPHGDQSRRRIGRKEANRLQHAKNGNTSAAHGQKSSPQICSRQHGLNTLAGVVSFRSYDPGMQC